MTLTDHLQPLMERRIPAAILAAFLLQAAAALFWAGSAAERIATLERTQDEDRAAIEQVAVIAEQVRSINAAVGRIETKLDRNPAQNTRN